MRGEDRILLHPVFSTRYHNFYLEGLRRTFPQRTMVVSGRAFHGWIGPRDGMAVIVEGEDQLRLYFHADDRPEIYRRELRWSDAYGMVNLDPAEVGKLPPTPAGKMLALGPSFSVRFWGGGRAVAGVALDLPKAVREGLPRKAWRRYLGDRRMQLARPRLDEYSPGRSEAAYVFFASTWWPGEDTRVNALRQRFAEAARSRDVEFEGGFARGRGATEPPADFVLPQRYTAHEYLARTARSTLVFNVPAVHGCHGWKLGEYLALGKAVVSLPLHRALPAPLVHGEHVHYVSGPDDIGPAVSRLLADEDYRRRLERGARSYWEEQLAPEVAVGRMMTLARRKVHERDPVTLGRPPEA